MSYRRITISLCLLAASLFVSRTGWASTTSVTATITDTSGAAPASCSVRFVLQGFGPNVPRVVGTSVLVDKSPINTACVGSAISQVLTDVATISPNTCTGPGGACTWYHIQFYQNGQIFREGDWQVTGATYNLNTVAPMSTAPVVSPPLGDSVYLRTDLGNSQLLPGGLSGVIAAPLADKGGVCWNPAIYGGAGDIGVKINATYAVIPTGGGTICLGPGIFNFSTPIAITTNGKPAIIQGVGNGATILNYTPATGDAVTFNYGEYIAQLPSPALVGAGLRDLSLKTSTSTTSRGLVFGGNLGANGSLYAHVTITGFSTNIVAGNNVQFAKFFDADISGGTQLFNFSGATNSGENILFEQSRLHNAGTLANAIFIDGTGNGFYQEVTFNMCQFDYGAQVYVKNAIVRIYAGHWENNTDVYFLIADTGAVVAVRDVVVSQLANPAASALTHALSGGFILFDNLIKGSMALNQAYLITNIDAGGHASALGASVTNSSGFWNFPSMATGAGTFSQLETANSNGAQVSRLLDGVLIGGTVPTAGAGQIGLSGTTSATATAGAIVSPGNFAGFLTINLGGTNIKVPYFQN